MSGHNSPIDIEVLATPVQFGGKTLLHSVWRDLTDIKQQQKALQESELRYRNLFEKSADALMISEGDRFTYCNEAAVKMFGYNSQEEMKSLPQSTFSPVVQPDGQDSFEKATDVTAAAFKVGSHRFEWQHQRKNGEAFSVEVLLTAISEDGNPLLHIVLRDISENKKQQKALQQSELRYRSLFEKSADAFVLVENGRFIDANEATLELLGYDTVDELINVSPVDLSPPTQPDGSDSQIKVKKILADCYRKDSYRFEWMYLRKDGESIPVEVLTTLIPIGDRLILHTILRDLTELKKQQKVLAERELQHRTFFDRSSDAFLLISENKFVEVNDATVKMLGYASKEELKSVHPSLVSPAVQADGRDSVESSSEMMGVALEQGAHRFEWLHQRKNGEVFPVDVSLTRVVIGGKTMLHVVWRDLTEFKKQQQALVDSELQHRTFFNGSNDAFLLACESKFVEANDAAVNMLGYTSKEELRLAHPAALSPAVQADGRDSTEKADEMMGIALEKGSHRFEWLHQRKNGEVFPVDVSLTRIIIDGKPLLHTIWRDLTDVKQQQQALFNSERKYKALFEQSADALILSTGDKFIDCNEAAFKMLGYSSKQEMMNVHPAELSPVVQPDGRDSFEKATEVTAVAFEKGSNRFEWYHKRKNGEVFPVEVLITAIPYGDEKLLHIVWRDITEMKRQQETLQHLAHYDSLTGLPNRVLFADRFQQATAHSKRTDTQLAVCFLDLDNFKPINDTFGHDVGDTLLIEVAQRITASIREEDTVSRQGGDEFTLLLGGLNSYQECEQLIDRMLHNLCEPYLIAGHAHSVTASCGITLYPTDDGDIDLLVRHADHAMYQAKLEGKNTFAFFNADTEHASQQHMAFLQRVSQAIVNDELLLHYQPKIDMRKGRMFGAEALIRWQHPDDGLISPFGFLPKIENTQVMVDVGNWVIEQALVQLSQWCKVGKNWVISINIDAYHFMQEDFVEHLKQALEKHPDVPAKQLEIEILETVAFDDLEHVSTTINACQALGVSFALDDFGTGYSSLAYLKGLPVQWLKIDQSFVRDMLVDAQDLSLIEGIVSLAKAFKREVIAEGVETVEHGSALLKLGCYNAQGYGIAKPMPAQELLPWQESYQADKSWTRYSKITLIENDL